MKSVRHSFVTMTETEPGQCGATCELTGPSAISGAITALCFGCQKPKGHGAIHAVFLDGAVFVWAQKRPPEVSDDFTIDQMKHFVGLV